MNAKVKSDIYFDSVSIDSRAERTIRVRNIKDDLERRI